MNLRVDRFLSFSLGHILKNGKKVLTGISALPSSDVGKILLEF